MAGRVLRIEPNALVVLCGPAACGKSTFARRHFKDTEIVSSDRCRAMLSDYEDSQWVSGRAFELFHFILRRRVELGRFTVADATSIERAARRTLIELARDAGRPVRLLMFDVSFETCLKRDASRPRRVGPEVIRRHRQQFEASLASAPDEGFDGVIVLSESEMDDAAIERASC